MKLLLIGECYSENLGDAVICQTVAKIIRSKYVHADITFFDISGRIGYQQYYAPKRYTFTEKCIIKTIDHFPSFYKRFNFFRLYTKDEGRYIRTITSFKNNIDCNDYDLAIFVGGALFMDYFAGLIYYVVRKLTLAGVPIVFHACGMGELSNDAIFLLRKTFKSHQVLSVSLRDSIKRFEQLFGDIITPKDTFDTALCCSNFFEAASEKVAEYGIGVIEIMKYHDIQKEIILSVIQSGVSFRVFTNGAPHDEHMARLLLYECGYSDQSISKVLLPRPLSPEELIYNITSFNKVISFRLHSQIIATSYGIESIGYTWDNKVQTFYDKLNLSFCYHSPEKPLTNITSLLSRRLSSYSFNAIVKNAKETCYRDLLKELEIICNEV